MFYVRADVNEVIATGHVMRNISLGIELKKHNEKLIFIVSDETSEDYVRSKGWECININCTWNELDGAKERATLESIIKKEDKLIIDTYYADSDYVKMMKGLCQIICYDDLFEYELDADVIINYNLYYKKFAYKDRYPDKKLLLGGKYVPLRPQFSEVKIKNRKESELKDILMICGGGDAYGAQTQITQHILNSNSNLFSNFNWHIIVGAYNNSTELEGLAKKNNNIFLYKYVENMAELMAKCDICISAASTVLYEACSCELPTIFYCVADNQKYDAECFGENDMMLYAGDFVNDKSDTLSSIEQLIVRLLNREKYIETLKKMKGVVDANGAERLVKEIRKN